MKLWSLGHAHFVLKFLGCVRGCFSSTGKERRSKSHNATTLMWWPATPVQSVPKKRRKIHLGYPPRCALSKHLLRAKYNKQCFCKGKTVITRIMLPPCHFNWYTTNMLQQKQLQIYCNVRKQRKMMIRFKFPKKHFTAASDLIKQAACSQMLPKITQYQI